jgi:hypothetical protein
MLLENILLELSTNLLYSKSYFPLRRTEKIFGGSIFSGTFCWKNLHLGYFVGNTFTWDIPLEASSPRIF